VTRQDFGSVLRFFAEIACSVEHDECAVTSEDQGMRQRSDRPSHEIEAMAPPASTQE
jgi:hypothetical protein